MRWVRWVGGDRIEGDGCLRRYIVYKTIETALNLLSSIISSVN